MTGAVNFGYHALEGVINEKALPSPVTNVRTLYPANLPPPGRRDVRSFGFWFRLLFWGTVALILVTWGFLGSKPDTVLRFFIGAPFAFIFLMDVGFNYGYLVPRFWSSIVAKFYLSESTATVSKRFLRAGEEFQFTYRQSFKRRTRVRRLCISLVSREYEVYEAGHEESIKMERWDDKAIEEFNQPGWQAQPGETLQQTVAFRFADPPILLNKSESYLIQVYIYLNWLVTLQRVYRLYMSPS